MRSEAGSSPIDASFPDRWTAYDRLYPLLLRAVAKLGRTGFWVSPSDGIDLINDFFIEEWDKLARNYRPGAAGVNGYAYRAFQYFARRRIVLLRQWSNSLSDAARMSEQPAVVDELAPAEMSELLGALDRAVESLPEECRTALAALTAEPRVSERTLAARLKITRHRLRERVAEGLGRVAVALDARESVSEEDWPVAVALWREGRSVPQAAAHFGRTPRAIQEARQRIVQRLGMALGRRRGPKPPASEARPG